MCSEGGACVNAAVGLQGNAFSAACLLSGECWPSKGEVGGEEVRQREKQGGGLLASEGRD